MKTEKIFHSLLTIVSLVAICVIALVQLTRPKISARAELVDVVTNRFAGGGPGEADAVEFRFRFNVTARGGDVFVDGETASDGAASYGYGFGWSLSPDSSAGTRVESYGLSALGGASSRDTAAAPRRFFVADGHTRAFDFRVRLSAGQDNAAAGVRIDAIRWGESAIGVAPRLAAFDAGKFGSDLVSGLQVR